MGELDFGRLKSEIHVLFCDGICMRVKEGFERGDRKAKKWQNEGRCNHTFSFMRVWW